MNYTMPESIFTKTREFRSWERRIGKAENFSLRNPFPLGTVVGAGVIFTSLSGSLDECRSSLGSLAIED